MANFDPDATFVHEGNAIDYTPGADVAAGEVVDLSTVMIGVAAEAIPSGKLGALQVEGVFAMKKDGAAYSAGDPVGWDGSTIVAAGTDGIVVLDAAAGDSRAYVKLTPG